MPVFKLKCTAAIGQPAHQTQNSPVFRPSPTCGTVWDQTRPPLLTSAATPEASQVAALIGVRKHRIEYALTSGYLPEPKLRFLGKRVFDPSDLLVVASYFRKDIQRSNSCCDPNI